MGRRSIGIITFMITALATGICLNFLFASVSIHCEVPDAKIPYYKSYGNFWNFLESHNPRGWTNNYIYYPPLFLNAVIFGVPICFVLLWFVNRLGLSKRATITILTAASLPPIVVSVFILAVSLTHRTHGYIGNWSWPSLPQWTEKGSCTQTVDRKNWFIFRESLL
ncbi:hypothetical protein SAMN04488030_1012 [Aliiroseovarius halocynthiae]|nr:hypothetical protein SAMN04488030_1012 [Aliiroseovarius halocynthiae]